MLCWRSHRRPGGGTFLRVEQCQGKSLCSAAQQAACESAFQRGVVLALNQSRFSPPSYLAGFPDCCEGQDSAEKLMSSAGISAVFPQQTQL